MTVQTCSTIHKRWTGQLDSIRSAYKRNNSVGRVDTEQRRLGWMTYNETMPLCGLSKLGLSISSRTQHRPSR